MTLGEWIEHIEQIRIKYQFGEITAVEYYTSVVGYAAEVPESDIFNTVEPGLFDEEKK